MTAEEFSKIPFRMVSRLSTKHERHSIYKNEEYGISIYKNTVKKNGFKNRKTFNYYLYQGVIYMSKKMFLEAYNKINYVK